MGNTNATTFYDATDVGGVRFLILSDLDQPMPKTRFKVTGAEKKKNAKGLEYPVLKVTDEEGSEYLIAAWKRDVRAPLQEWGGNPLEWGFLEIKPGNTRYEIIVASDQVEHMKVPEQRV